MIFPIVFKDLIHLKIGNFISWDYRIGEE